VDRLLFRMHNSPVDYEGSILSIPAILCETIFLESYLHLYVGFQIFRNDAIIVPTLAFIYFV
jgi:hypothetical protein